MERHFDRDLQELKERILYMGSLAETMIHLAVKALVDRQREVHRDPEIAAPRVGERMAVEGREHVDERLPKIAEDPLLAVELGPDR